MFKNLNLKQTLLVRQITRFLCLFFILYVGTILVLKIPGATFNYFYFFMFSFGVYIVSSIGDIHLSSHLLTLFYQRKSTRSFIIDAFQIKLILFILFISIIQISILSFDPLAFIKLRELLSLGSIAFITLVIYLFFFQLDLAALHGLNSSKNTQPIILSLKRIWRDFIKPVLFISLIVSVGYVSLICGMFLFLLGANFIFFSMPFIKNIFSQKVKWQYFIYLQFFYFIFCIGIATFEFLQGNHKFVFNKNSFKDISSFFKPKKDTVDTHTLIKLSEVKNFSGWNKWIEQKPLSNVEYVNAFNKLYEVCPPNSKRVNPLLNECVGCGDSWFSLSSNDIKALPTKDRKERINLFFQSNNEYSHLLGTAHAMFEDDVTKEIQDQILQIAKDNSSPLQGLALAFINKRIDRDERFYISFSNKEYDCKKSSGKKD